MKPPCAVRSILAPKSLAAGLAFGLVLCSAGVAVAQEESKVAVVDVAKIFTGYYRTSELDAKISEARKVSEDQLDNRMQEHHRLVEELARIDKALDNPGLGAPDRADRQKQRENNVGQTQKLEQEIKEFKASHERSLQEMAGRGRGQIVEDIMVVLRARVETRHYDLILNKSAKGVGSRAVVLYANDTLDITHDVLAALNSNRPASKPLVPAAAPQG